MKRGLNITQRKYFNGFQSVNRARTANEEGDFVVVVVFFVDWLVGFVGGGGGGGGRRSVNGHYMTEGPRISRT